MFSLQAKFASVKARADGQVLPARRPHTGLKVVKDIRKLQKTTQLLLPKRPFGHLVKTLTGFYSSLPEGLRWSVVAVEALQEATEAFLVETFQQANRCASHAKRYARVWSSCAAQSLLAVLDKALGMCL